MGDIPGVTTPKPFSFLHPLRVVVVGGDGRSGPEWPSTLTITVYPADEAARAEAAIRSGKVDALVILTRWVGHAAFTKLRTLDVRTFVWPFGQGRLAKELELLLARHWDSRVIGQKDIEKVLDVQDKPVEDEEPAPPVVWCIVCDRLHPVPHCEIPPPPPLPPEPEPEPEPQVVEPEPQEEPMQIVTSDDTAKKQPHVPVRLRILEVMELDREKPWSVRELFDFLGDTVIQSIFSAVGRMCEKGELVMVQDSNPAQYRLPEPGKNGQSQAHEPEAQVVYEQPQPFLVLHEGHTYSFADVNAALDKMGELGPTARIYKQVAVRVRFELAE